MLKHTAADLVLPLLISAICLTVPLRGNCQIYVGVDATQTSIVLSNFQSAAAPDLLVAVAESALKSTALSKSASGRRSNASLLTDDIRILIDSTARRVSISPELIQAVMSVESGYNPNALSTRGAIGLMQLLPSTAKRFGVDDPYIVRDNIFAGASYLKWLTEYLGDDIELVLAAYNAGEQAVLRAGRRIPEYPETQNYVRRVMAELRAMGEQVR